MSVPPYTCARLGICAAANVEASSTPNYGMMNIVIVVMGGALILLAVWEWLRGE